MIKDIKPIENFKPIYDKIVKEGGTLLLSSDEVASLKYEPYNVCYIKYPVLNETLVVEYELYHDSENRTYVNFYDRFGGYFNARLVKIKDFEWHL